MTDIEKLQAEELANLANDEEIFDLESLVTDGADARIPITVEYPRKDGSMASAGAMIRPLTNVEWNNATRLSRKGTGTTNEVELVKIGLYTKKGEQFPPELVEKLPAGLILKLVEELARVSGIDLYNKRNLKIAKTLMDF